MDADALNSIFIQSTAHVLSTMAQCNPIAGKPYVKQNTIALGDYTAYICANCTSTTNKGSIAMTFTISGASYLAKSMFGEDVDDEQSLREVVGEIVNIVSGDARRRMATQGVVFDGSTPKMLQGAGHSVLHDTKAHITVIPFNLPEGQFVVEFGFEI